jgi:hypothetical protein
MKQIHLFFGLCFFVLTSCDNNQEVSQTNGLLLELKHSLTEKGDFTELNFFIYETEGGYLNNSTPYISGKTSTSSGTYFIPSKKLKVNQQYYIDWYSDDYSITNWSVSSSGDRLSPNMFVYQGGLQSFGFSYVGDSSDGNARNIFLNGNEIETTWKATGSTELGNNIWESLTENEKYIRVKFRKDWTGIYMEKNMEGQEIVRPFLFVPRRQITLLSPTNSLVGIIDETSQTSVISLGPGNRRYTYSLTRE